MVVVGLAAAAIALSFAASPTGHMGRAVSCPPESRFVYRYMAGGMAQVPQALASAEVLVDLPEIGARAVCLTPGEVEAASASAAAAGIRLTRDPVARIPEGDYGLVLGPVTPPAEVAQALEPREAEQWWLGAIAARSGWPISRGRGTKIAVIDSGVLCQHPDLAGQCFVAEDYVGGNQYHPHGTHVAGIAAAALDQYGIAGTAPEATIASYRVFGPDGYGSSSVAARAILDAAAPGVVLNMSFGVIEWSQELADAVAVALSRKAVLVGAAGNYRTSAPLWPGCLPGVIGVGATDRLGRPASFTNFGIRCVDIAAPGVGVLSTVMNPEGTPEHTSYDGTSMAAPMVAGAAAALLAAGSRPENVTGIILRYSDSGPAELGGRALNVHAALQNWASDPGPTMTPWPTDAIPPTTNPYPGPPGTTTPSSSPPSPSATPSARPTASLTPSATASATRTATATASRTASATASATETASRTPTRTITATRTAPPIPSATPCVLQVRGRQGTGPWENWTIVVQRCSK